MAFWSQTYKLFFFLRTSPGCEISPNNWWSCIWRGCHVYYWPYDNMFWNLVPQWQSLTGKWNLYHQENPNYSQSNHKERHQERWWSRSEICCQKCWCQHQDESERYLLWLNDQASCSQGTVAVIWWLGLGLQAFTFCTKYLKPHHMD